MGLVMTVRLEVTGTRADWGKEASGAWNVPHLGLGGSYRGLYLCKSS